MIHVVEEAMKILESKEVRAAERHESALQFIIAKIHQQLRIENSDGPAEIRIWTKSLEAEIK